MTNDRRFEKITGKTEIKDAVNRMIEVYDAMVDLYGRVTERGDTQLLPEQESDREDEIDWIALFLDEKIDRKILKIMHDNQIHSKSDIKHRIESCDLLRVKGVGISTLFQLGRVFNIKVNLLQ